MARVLVCAGRRSKVPLRLQNTNKKLYSAEEVCYYLYHNASTAEDYLTDAALAEYYEKELGLSETAERLRVLAASEATTKEYALLLFSVTPMYTNEEITEFLKELERLEERKYWQKQKAKADVYLEHRNYRDAANVYERLLQDRKESGMPEVAAGNVYHNLAVCELHISGAGRAAEHFANAYEKNRDSESLRSYLFALRLAQKDKEYRAALVSYEVSDALRNEIDTMLFDSVVEAGEDPEYQNVARVKKLLADGQLSEYRHATEELLEGFKKQYRLDNM
ncbi:MAG: hypothetical protein IJW37_02525 [Lachnospiraceae bacterium]|nr:hypothetical protein [Lachnospiraceae bacterium]